MEYSQNQLKLKQPDFPIPSKKEANKFSLINYKDYVDRLARVLTHELVHTSTSTIFDSMLYISARTGKPLIKDPELKKIADEFNQLHSLVLEYYKREYPNKNLPYGLTNIHEFAAESATNKDFRKLLESIPTEKLVKIAKESKTNEFVTLDLTSFKTVYDAFKDFLNRIVSVLFNKDYENARQVVDDYLNYFFDKTGNEEIRELNRLMGRPQTYEQAQIKFIQ
jgi:hypothetical protein